MGLQEGEHLVETFERHRLADEVERAQPQALAGLGLGGHAGDGDDGQRGLAHGPQLQEVEAAHAGQVDVEDDGVGALTLEGAQRGLGAAHDDRVVSELDEEVTKHLAERFFILDDEHSHDGPGSLARSRRAARLRRTPSRMPPPRRGAARCPTSMQRRTCGSPGR